MMMAQQMKPCHNKKATNKKKSQKLPKPYIIERSHHKAAPKKMKNDTSERTKNLNIQ